MYKTQDLPLHFWILQPLTLVTAPDTFQKAFLSGSTEQGSSAIFFSSTSIGDSVGIGSFEVSSLDILYSSCPGDVTQGAIGVEGTGVALTLKPPTSGSKVPRIPLSTLESVWGPLTAQNHHHWSQSQSRKSPPNTGDLQAL